MTTRSAAKDEIVDKILARVAEYAASRDEQRAIRRTLKTLGCTKATRDEPAPCYHPTDGRTPWCDACREHDQRFGTLLQVRRLNAKRLQQVERLARRFAAPEPESPPEPKVLLEMMESHQDA